MLTIQYDAGLPVSMSLAKPEAARLEAIVRQIQPSFSYPALSPAGGAGYGYRDVA